MRTNLFILTFLLSVTISYGQTWSALGTGINTGGECFASFNGEMYVGGNFTNAGGVAVNNIAKWNGTSWSDVGGGTDGFVHALIVFNGQLYVGGEFYNAGGTTASRIAKWNGTTWSAVGTGLMGGCINCGVYGFGIYNAELYAAGNLPDRVDKWDGTNWVPVGIGLLGPGGCTLTTCFAEYNGDLYIGGQFDVLINGNTCGAIVKFDGSAFSVVGTGISWGYINAMKVYNGDLYIVGGFETPFDIGNGIEKWNGTSWTAVAGGLYSGSNAARPRSLEVYNSELYVGGDLNLAGTGTNGVGAPGIVKWDGTNWHFVGALYNSSQGVDALGIHNGQLYATGYFTAANGTFANHIAKLNGVSGVDDLADEYSITIFPNPGTSLINLTSNKILINATLDVYDLLGKSIKQVNNVSGRTIKLSQNGLQQGIYFLQLTSDNKIITTKKMVIH